MTPSTTPTSTGLPPTRRCRSCGADIRWVTTGSGKRMPIDAHPSRAGNVQLVDTEDGVVGEVMRGNRAVDARARGLELFVAHFATCPNADTHRHR